MKSILSIFAVALAMATAGQQRIETRTDGVWLVVSNVPVPYVVEHTRDFTNWTVVVVGHELQPAGSVEIKLAKEGDKDFWRVRRP